MTEKVDTGAQRCERCRVKLSSHGKAYVLDGGTTVKRYICPVTKGRAVGPA